MIDPPFILGGMGVRTTDHSLASAAANCGMAGTIASVGLVLHECRGADYVEESNAGLRKEIRLARELSSGIIGANVMVALTNYDELIRTAVDEKVDYIISGAGLPLSLPGLVGDSDTCLIPIVSSARAADTLCKRWWSRYGRLPDALVVEGALAGGHLGLSLAEVGDWNERTIDGVCADVLDVVGKHEADTGKHIPVVAAGGIFDGKDIARLLALGVEGVQMATRFIATTECSLPSNCKQIVLDARKEDMALISSPVGLPARAVRNDLVRRIERGERIPFSCPYHCLRTCNPGEADYCIASALVCAHQGDDKNGLIMAGYNAYRVNEIVPVRELVDKLVAETLAALSEDTEPLSLIGA